MNIYSLLLFTSTIIYLSLGLRMFNVRPMPRLSVIFIILCSAFAYWSFCIAFMFAAPNQEVASLWFKLSAPSWALIPALLLHFTLVLTGREQRLGERRLGLLLLYLPGIIFAYREITVHVTAISFTLQHYGWTGINPTDSPWFIAFNAYYILFVFTSASILYSWKNQTESPREKSQARIIIIAVMVSVILTFINDTLLPSLGVDIIPKFPSFLALIWAYGMWYAITKYRLMDVSPALTGELVLAELLTKLLRAVIENSGAQRAVIILEQDGRMLIQGEALILSGTEKQKVLHSIPLEESFSLPHTILNQVSANREKVVLSDASKEPGFAGDPYLKREQTRSLLVMPLLLRGMLKGMLYLENKQFSHVFTPERVEALQVLTSQVVVSLQNAIRFASLQESHDRLSEWNQLLEQTVQERTRAVRNLLDNAGQGFLTFGPDLLVDEEYSAECERIFGKKIDGARISSILFPHNEEEQTMVEEIIEQISEEKEEFRREIYLSLLPEEVKLNGSNVQLEFKLLQNSREDDGEREDLLMLILTDITEKRKMEATLQEEKNLFEMIVRVVSNFVDFNATLREYDEFCCNYRQEFAPARDSMHTYTGVMRSIHTFKGLFHQFGMLNMVAKLHGLETKLQELQGPGGACPTRDAVLGILDSESMVEWLEEDLLVLKNILGDTYFLQENTLVIDMNSLQEMEQQMLTNLTPPQINLLLPELRKITWKPFREALKAYPDYIQRLSSQTEKLVYPLELEGGIFKVDLELYRDFVKSLGHVFRNSLDHGIELPEERVACGKEERGRIHCRVFQDNGSIVLEIGDDGRGISIERIREKALQLQETSQGAFCALPGSEEKLLQLIFEDRFSTQGGLTELSGRGVGLAAVKKEVVKLGGKIEVENFPGEGTTLKFLLPQENGSPLKKPSYFEVIGLFLQSAHSVLLEQAGVNIQAPSATNLKVADHVRLLDITSIMPLRGVITGKIVLTASRQLCSHMLDHYAMWEVDEAERENCYDDLLTELLNLITGSFLGIFPGGEFVISGLPEKIEAESACLKNSGNELLTYGVELEYGALSFTFVPESDDFLSVAPAELLERFKA